MTSPLFRSPSQDFTKGQWWQRLMPGNVQTKILQLKKDNPARSINTLIDMVEREGLVSKGSLARATVHRFLQHHILSKQILPNQKTIERRSFVAEKAGDLWQGGSPSFGG